MKVFIGLLCLVYLTSAKVVTEQTKGPSIPPKTTTQALTSSPEVTPSEHFLHKLQLDADGAFWLFWNTNTTHVTFETHAKTHGYVGFGLSGSGKMFPGDIVIGWIKDGITHFKDCHTVGHVMPKEDESQDWILLEGEENEKGTRLKFTRKIDTCDKDDFRITDETIRVIFSYHPEDPVSLTSLPWHGASRRGTQSVLLLSASSPPKIALPSNTREINLVKSNYHVPAVGTTYHCSTLRLPDLNEKNHIIKYEPVIQKGNELHVHHMVIYTVPHPVDRRYDNINYDCTHGKNTPASLRRRDIFIVWAVGGRDFYFPDYAGISIGMPDDPKFFILEIHYDNPTLKSDIVDSSGLRFVYTPNLRQHDAGVIYASMSVSPIQIVPPYEKEFTTKALCSEECLEKVVPDNGVNVFAVFQHAHLLATGITTHHFRNGSELKPFAKDEHYDFNFQDVRLLKPEQKLMKGDSIRVDCIYNSERKTKVTYGGLSTEEEMCVSTLLYYPRMPLSGCGSYPMYEVINSTDIHAAITDIASWDWTQPSIRRHFRTVLEQSDYKLFCYGPTIKESEEHFVGKMEVPTTRYAPRPRNCPQQ